MKRYDTEYQVCKAISTYMAYQYPDVLWHWDLSGLHHTKTQAGLNKVIQHSRGWPDLFVAEPREFYHGLFIEVKAENIRLVKQDGTDSSIHIFEQKKTLTTLERKGYAASFAVGFEQCKLLIDTYLRYGKVR